MRVYRREYISATSGFDVAPLVEYQRLLPEPSVILTLERRTPAESFHVLFTANELRRMADGIDPRSQAGERISPAGLYGMEAA